MRVNWTFHHDEVTSDAKNAKLARLKENVYRDKRVAIWKEYVVGRGFCYLELIIDNI